MYFFAVQAVLIVYIYPVVIGLALAFVIISRNQIDGNDETEEILEFGSNPVNDAFLSSGNVPGGVVIATAIWV